MFQRQIPGGLYCHLSALPVVESEWSAGLNNKCLQPHKLCTQALYIIEHEKYFLAYLLQGNFLLLFLLYLVMADVEAKQCNGTLNPSRCKS